MKNYKSKDISVSDLANEFNVSKSSIELYGIHRLLLPIPDQKSKPVYRPLDKARLKFIVRAKNADYTIGSIKNLIGVIDLGKNEVDQIEESLVFCKKNAAALKDNLEDLDALEQINATCDLELLEGYITDLNNLKYGLDITPIKTALPEPDTETSHAKPRTLVYSHVDDQINAAAPAIAPKKSRMPLFVIAGIFLVATTAYLYLGGDLVPDISNDLAVTLQKKPAELTDATVASNKTEEIYLSETDTNPDEGGRPIADEPDSTEDLFPSLDFQTSKNKNSSPYLESTDSMESGLQNYSDEQNPDTKMTQVLMDVINKSRKTTQEPESPAKENTEDIFFKQLVADLKNKYDEQAQSQKPSTNDTTEINTAPEKISEEKETQSLAAIIVPNDDPRTSKTKTSLMQTDTAPPEKVAPSSKLASSATQNKSPAKQAATSTKKTKTSTLQKPTEPARIAVTPPKPKPKPKPTVKSKIKSEPAQKPVPEPKPEPEPKPKTVPQKPTNPEALKWAQKSYESVMSGNAGEAIVAASVAITLDPNLVNAYINRSWAYSKKGLYDRAIQDCDKALDIDNDNALAYNNRGLAFQGKGDIDKARSDYDRACKLGFDLGCKNYQEVVGGVADSS